MRRVAIALTAISVALVMAMPVGAAPPKCAEDPYAPGCPPVDEVVQYSATMGFFDGADGFSTGSIGCTTGGSLTMDLTPQGDLGAALDVVPFLEVQIGDVNWYRYYPYFGTPSAVPEGFDPDPYPLGEADRLEGGELSGCHGGGVDVTIAWVDDKKVLDSARDISEAGNLFRLIPSDGAVELLWHSDYYREFENVGKKRPRYVANDIEDFTYSAQLAWNDSNGDPVVWDPAIGASGVASGNMRISHFSPGTYAQFNEAGFPVKFMLSIMPSPES